MSINVVPFITFTNHVTSNGIHNVCMIAGERVFEKRTLYATKTVTVTYPNRPQLGYRISI